VDVAKMVEFWRSRGLKKMSSSCDASFTNASNVSERGTLSFGMLTLRRIAGKKFGSYLPILD
jgi:hypothetical protein